MFKRKKTRQVKIGNLTIGGDNPVRIQSMTNTKTKDIEVTVRQIQELEKNGCEIIRVAIPDMQSAQVLSQIKAQITIPLVADIHFQYLFALEAIKQGADKIRINPGNIGGEEKIKAVVKACQEKNIPIRIGINMGSLEKDLYSEFGKFGVARVMVESAHRNINILEKLKFFNIVVSLKGSDVPTTIEAYQLFSKRFDYPIHLGITESGNLWRGTVKSSLGIGILLNQGLGDTIRVSLSAPPVEEVKVGWEILKSLNLRSHGIKLVSCPTCGRTEIDLFSLVEKVDKALSLIQAPLTVAVMGCIVNGPGEAKFADIGITGGNGMAVIFKKDKVIKTVRESEAFPVFMEEIKKILLEKGHNKDAKSIST